MFIIGGLSPKLRTLDPTPRICPACGLAQAYLKQVDHYINLFFIPLFRVKKGKPFLFCDRCQNSGFLHPADDPLSSPGIRCRTCGREIQPEFRFCPHCGKPL
jgi:hypothetical protein